MKPRGPDRSKPATELDALDAQLDEVRTESRRLARLREATERKLEDIGKNLSQLKSQLDKSRTGKSRAKK